MRLELAPGGATPSELERARVDVSSALDDARSFLARRDAPRAAHAFDAVARARFFFSRIESQAAFELALDALSLAAHAVTTGDDTHDPTRLAGAELGSSAATVVASVIRDAEARRDGYARAAATRGVDAFLRGVLRARELAKLSSSAVTSSVLALMAIGSEESSRRGGGGRCRVGGIRVRDARCGGAVRVRVRVRCHRKRWIRRGVHIVGGVGSDGCRGRIHRLA